MDWITEHIAIGNFIDAEKTSKNEVDAVLCLKPDCCSEDNKNIDVMCLPLEDGAGNDRRYFNDAVDFIDDVVSSGERILVHCHAGRSRSVCMVARYFMMKMGMTSHQAIEKIEDKREIYLSPGIEEILEI
jgi:protein-tyrosine phosphatase